MEVVSFRDLDLPSLRIADMARRLREGERFPGVRVVGWENRNGKYHAVYDQDEAKVGRAPTDRSLERAERIVFSLDENYYTVGPLTPDYGLDDAIQELEDAESL